MKTWSNSNSYWLLVGIQNGTTTLEDILGVSWKAKYNLTIWSRSTDSNNTPFYPNEVKTYVYKKTCTWMFMVAVFVSAQILKQTSCPSVGECVTPTQWIIIQQFKKKELSSHKKVWRTVKCILLTERRQSEILQSYCVTLNYRTLLKWQNYSVRRL